MAEKVDKPGQDAHSGTEMQVYECRNSSCSLGSRKTHGRFTSGMTSQQVNLLDGTPEENLVEGEHFGEGICPNCGQPGTPLDEIFEHAGAGVDE